MSQSRRIPGTQYIGPDRITGMDRAAFVMQFGSAWQFAGCNADSADAHAAQSNSLTVGLLYFGRWDGERYQRRMAAQYAAVMAGAWRGVLMEDMYAFHVFGHHASA